MNSSKIPADKSILVVDDEEDVLDFLRLYLESLGWKVTTSSSAREALQELAQQPYFLVITDIAMPEMDGYEFVAKVRQSESPPQVALMTGFGYNPKHTLIKINRRMRHPCLFKPFNRRKVAETVQAAWEAYRNGSTWECRQGP